MGCQDSRVRATGLGGFELKVEGGREEELEEGGEEEGRKGSIEVAVKRARRP
jgi:hypothetical protein